jgi:phosphatidylglycerol---prolipoprotein diacylglyceryl transferase
MGTQPIAYFFWDPAREIFSLNIPILDRPILWYGLFFALGFFTGYRILAYLLKHNLELFPELRHRASALAERITFYVMIGTLLGARAADLLFYQELSGYLRDPLSMIKIWEGGLASHGGAIGILVALYLLSRKVHFEFPHFSYLTLIDFVVIPTGLVGALIRIGNFFNQEILGTPSDLPWAVVFGHPADHSRPTARHPVQLYEALYYFSIFILLFSLWKRVPKFQTKGRATGLFLVLVFLFRFSIEFLKEEQSAWLHPSSLLTMGQYLSLPLILLGCILLGYPFFFKIRSGTHTGMGAGTKEDS